MIREHRKGCPKEGMVRSRGLNLLSPLSRLLVFTRNLFVITSLFIATLPVPVYADAIGSAIVSAVVNAMQKSDSSPSDDDD